MFFGLNIFHVGFVTESYIGFATVLYRICKGQCGDFY
jgi:hypothetical protein